MIVRLKFIATYIKLLPAGTKRNIIDIEVVPGSTLENILSQFNVPMDDSSVVLLNGFTVSLDTQLSNGDTISAFSAIAGG